MDFTESYSPVGFIDSIHLILALSASLCYTLHVLDISNAFQNGVIFDPEKRVYLFLPPFYLDWFRSQWLDYKLPSQDSAQLALQCLKSIQSTCDAGHHCYALISSHFGELGMNQRSLDHGIFLWKWNEET